MHTKTKTNTEPPQTMGGRLNNKSTTTELHAWWSTHSHLTTLLSFLIACLPVGPQILRGFRPTDEREGWGLKICLWIGPLVFNYWISFVRAFS